MPFNATALGQLLKIVPRLEFEKLANAHDGKRRSDALSRWSQFVALRVDQLISHHSLRNIEAVFGYPIRAALSLEYRFGQPFCLGPRQ